MERWARGLDPRFVKFLRAFGRALQPAIEREVAMPLKSKSQAKLMRAAAHDPGFARRVGVPVKVAKEFVRADQGKAVSKGKPKGK
jgi:hypothetical protein